MLRLPSCPKSIVEVEAFVKELSEKFNISQDKYPNILISLTEAVNNAILHGNRKDEKKYVKIASAQTLVGIKLSVSDEGTGFDPAAVPDPTATENIDCCGGRGVFLIRQLSDQVSYFNNGSTVEMHFRLTPENIER